MTAQKSIQPAKPVLLDMGLHFIYVALDALLFKRARIDNPILFSLIYASTGIELVLKHRLFLEHWSLVFEVPERANWRDYIAGDFQSVTVDGCLKRLEVICRIPFTQDEKVKLANLRDMRNRLIHFGTTTSHEATAATVAGAVHVILDFVDKAFSMFKLSKNQELALKQIRKTGASSIFYVEERWKEIQSNVEKASVKQAVVRCSRCHQESALFVKRRIKCLFCKHVVTDTEEVLHENLRSPRIMLPGMKTSVEPGCCSDRVFRLEWRDVKGKLLELERICFTCGKRLEWKRHWGVG